MSRQPEAPSLRWEQVQLLVFDFDGVFTDNTVWVSQDGVESVRCSRSDGLGLARLRALGLPMYLMSTEVNPVVSVRAAKLQLPCEQAVADKGQAVRDLCARLGIDLIMTCFLGNDINDLPAFGQVGFPVAVADAYPEVFDRVVYRTQRAGGFGAVRELCDLIYRAKTAGVADG